MRLRLQRRLRTTTAVSVLAVALAAGAVLSAAQSHPAWTPPQSPPASLTRTTISFEDARPILEALRTDLLPREIQNQTADERRRSWPRWIARRDAEIRARVDRGDDDSLANLLLFGTSFLSRPHDGAVVTADKARTPPPPRDEPDVERRLDEPWNTELIAYWNQFGDGIGVPASAMVPADVKAVAARAIRVSPGTVLSIVPQDLNIVVERLEPPPESAGFDLIIGTNIFLYYEVFEQSLALANVSSMLRAGGLFLSNDFLNLLPAIPLNAVGLTDVGYSPTAAGSGDRVFWYQRQ